MASNIQSLGYLLKKEKLATLASELSLSEMLLESLHPFPGFYEEYFVPTTSSETKPQSVFMVIKDFDVCYEDEFIRINMNIKRNQDLKFDAALSSIFLFNEAVTAIRVHMADYSQLHELIDFYKESGVEFKARKQVKPYDSLIKIHRFFDLEEMDEGVYKDLDKPGNHFVIVPSYLPWDEFVKVTVSIRNNCEYKSFDAAQAAIYDKTGVVELVRIYDPGADVTKLISLRQKYIAELERM